MTGAFLLCATFEVMGFCEGFGAYRYSRRLTRPMDKPLCGVRVLKFDGAIAPRVLKFDAPPARVLWWRL